MPRATRLPAREILHGQTWGPRSTVTGDQMASKYEVDSCVRMNLYCELKENGLSVIVSALVYLKLRRRLF